MVLGRFSVGGVMDGYARGRRMRGILDPPKAQKSKKINQTTKSQSHNQKTPLHACVQARWRIDF